MRIHVFCCRWGRANVEIAHTGYAAALDAVISDDSKW